MGAQAIVFVFRGVAYTAAMLRAAAPHIKKAYNLWKQSGAKKGKGTTVDKQRRASEKSVEKYESDYDPAPLDEVYNPAGTYPKNYPTRKRAGGSIGYTQRWKKARKKSSAKR